MHPELGLVPSVVVFVAASWAYLRDLISLSVLIPIVVVTLLAIHNWRVRHATDSWR